MTPGRGSAAAAPSGDAAAEAAALFARLGALADEVLDAIARGDATAMHAALDERDRVGHRLDPLVLALRVENSTRLMADVTSSAAMAVAQQQAHDHAGAGHAAAAVWAAAKQAESKQDALIREVRLRREAAARELAGLRETRSVSASYRAVEPAVRPRLNLVR